MRATALIGMLTLGLALGSIVVGQMILVPELRADTSLVDANLARALAEPLILRSAELALAACLALAAVSGRWLGHRAGTSLGLIAAGVAALDRLVLIPRMNEAWGRVDLVAMRPQVRVEAAEQLSSLHLGALAALTVVLLAIAGLSCLDRVPRS